MANKLIYGDCLTILDRMPLKSVDLIYLDPPFNSNRQYNSIYKDETGRPLPDQIEAFCDAWILDDKREESIRLMPRMMIDAGIDDAVARLWEYWVKALRGTQPRLLAYLSYMTERLLQMRQVLKGTGSIYLHCDPTASHYIKVIMDGIFDHQNFRNEVIWRRTKAHNSAQRWGPIHDTLLFYSVTDNFTWNRQPQAYDPEYIEKSYRHSDDRGNTKRQI